MTDTPNRLSTRGAACIIGRDKTKLQIQIVCETEDEAKRILEDFMEQVRSTGRAVMYFGGTIDEPATAGRRN